MTTICYPLVGDKTCLQTVSQWWQNVPANCVSMVTKRACKMCLNGGKMCRSDNTCRHNPFQTLSQDKTACSCPYSSQCLLVPLSVCLCLFQFSLSLCLSLPHTHPPHLSMCLCPCFCLSVFPAKHIKGWRGGKKRYLLGQNTICANFRGNPLYPATKRHLNNSQTVTNDEKWDGKLNHLSVFGWAVLFSCLVLGWICVWN